MPLISRIGDIGLGHGSFPPTPAITGSTDTFSGNLSVHRVGDSLLPHPSPSPSPPHPRTTVSGSTTVFCNSMPVARVGDSVSCGGVLVQGNPTVMVGG